MEKDIGVYPHVELPEYEGTKGSSSSGANSQNLDQSQQEQTPLAVKSSAFRKIMKPKLLCLCLGFLALSGIIAFCVYIFSNFESVPVYHVTEFYQDDYQYSFLIKPNTEKANMKLRNIQKEFNLLPSMNVSIQCYTQNHYRLVINDPNNKRWEVPHEYPYPVVENPKPCFYKNGDIDFVVQESPFALKILRKSTGETIFDTKDSPFVFSNHYMEITNYLSSFDFFGLGERLYKLQMGPGDFTIWPKDLPQDIETGEPGHNNYGQQPLYLLREPSGNYHIVLLRNSNAMEIQIRKDRAMKFQVIGGILDFHIFVGSKDPEPIIEKYHDYLGSWTLPPFWSMGYHQSRWGMKYLWDMKEVLEGYKKNDIPLDVIWSDIDYMQDYLDFTIDQARYPPEDFAKTLKEYDKKWVPIIDAGIGISSSSVNVGFKKGSEKNLFLKNSRGENLLAEVWPGKSVFPDFLHPETENYWVDMLGVLNQSISFDGIWLDMNEVSNFCQGECNRRDWTSEFQNLPFLPGNVDVANKTVSLDAVHYGNVKEFDAHSLFNLLEQKATYKYLKKKSPLPFILTRANIFGSGKFSSHWFGDTHADWLSMKYTIGSLINYNLFGMPHSGADICGFMGQTTDDLCTRWTQLGIFYPFARNHHEIFSRLQEPYQFADPYKTAMIDAIKYRYSILKHYYTLFVSKNGKGTIVKPLYFEFLNDSSLFRYNNITEVKPVEEQFMIGKSIMVAPALYEGSNQVKAYFPEGAWYNLVTYENIRLQNNNRFLNVSAEKMTPNFLRGGHLIMMQNISNVKSSKDLTNEFSMVIGLPEEKTAVLSKDGTMKTLNALGEILDVASYDENTIHDECLTKDCVLEINTQFSYSLDKSNVNIIIEADRRDGTQTQADRGVMINEVRIMGDGIKDFNISFLRNMKIIKNDNTESQIIEKAEKIGDSLVIRFEPSVLLQGGGSIRLTHEL